jgi:hypothetical protein
MSDKYPSPMTDQELLAEAGTLLPAKEVLSVPLLDLNVDIDLALDLVAPIDLAVAGNLNVAAPITGAVGANVLSALSGATAVTEQGVSLDQLVVGDAIAHAPQTADVDQSDDIIGAADGADAGALDTTHGGALADTTVDPLDPVESTLDSPLLNVDVNVDLDADLAAPVAGAVAVNANVAAPIDAAVAANVGSVGSEAVASSTQTAIITQHLDGVTAEAIADQDVTLDQ